MALPRGEGATIEYAITALGVKDIILCGHSRCGAMQGLLNLDSLRDMPAVVLWLRHAEATRRIIHENYANETGAALLRNTVKENVLFRLRTCVPILPSPPD
jgi:carbonic anhydrase